MYELKVICWTCLFSVIAGIPAMYFIGWLFAKVTYSLAHRKCGKITNTRTKNMIVYNIDTKTKTLQEIQAERNEMMKMLGGF